MARRLQACAPEGSLVARLGGDEFACAVRYRGPSLETVDQIAQGVIARFGAPVDNDVFAGTVTLPSHRPFRPYRPPAPAPPMPPRCCMWPILRVSGQEAGPNQVLWFEATMESELRYRCEMEAAIRAVPGGRIRALLRTAGGSGQRRDLWASRCWRAGIRRCSGWWGRWLSPLPRKSA
jgi:GGDEF domain-containing protein